MSVSSWTTPLRRVFREFTSPKRKRGICRKVFPPLRFGLVWAAKWRCPTKRHFKAQIDRSCFRQNAGFPGIQPHSDECSHGSEASSRLPLVPATFGLTWPLVMLLVISPGLHPSAARAAGGRFQITVVDRDSGRPIACRMHLKNPAGRPRNPKSVPFWHDHFVFDGTINLNLPLGRYEFVIERGLEYVERSGHFILDRLADDSQQFDLLRFVDMSEHGWWSGDLDVHRSVRDLELLMKADDLHVVPLVTWWNDESQWAGRLLPKELLVRFDRDRYYHLMAGGQARPGGTLLYFNLPGPLELNGAVGDYPPMIDHVSQARVHPDAWVDVSKPYWWDLPTLVAHDQVDSIQVIHGNLCRDEVIGNENGGKARDTMLYPGVQGNGRWSEAIYFHLLNSGLRIPPTAGSGSGVSPNPLGYNRLYVHVDGEFSYQKWWESLAEGRVTITNGPLLRPTVHGQLPGHVFTAEQGQHLEFEIGLTLHTRERISYLEIVKNGQVEHSIPFNEYATSGRLPLLRFERSGWFLVKAVTDLGKTYRLAMTGPYHVQIGYEPRISRRSAQFFLDWVYERARQIELDDPDKQRAVIQYHRQARDFWQNRLSRANAD